jgi:hypothetical protein
MNNTIGCDPNVDITVTKENLFVLIDALHARKENLPKVNYLLGPISHIDQLIDYLKEKKELFN